MPRSRVLFALTSHGLGHATRSLAIARALCEAHRVDLVVATTIPRERLARDLPLPFEHRAVDYEPGAIQQTCFELDVPATRRAYAGFMRERAERIAQEVDFLRESGCHAVVSDVPALPVRAASQLGLPAIGVSNFTWDWVLEPLFEGTELAFVPGVLADDYAQGTHQLRLPFGPPGSPFPCDEEAPLVSRRAVLAAGEVRRRLGLPREASESLVLVCPGGWDPDGWPEIFVPGCSGLRFVTVGDLPIGSEAPLLSLPHALVEGVSFPDLVATADAVLAKPGYGIASECAAHRTALVSIERPGFRETPVLLEEFARLGPVGQLSLNDFFSGRWEDPLREVLASGAPWAAIPGDGASRVAQRIAQLAGLEPR